VISAKIKKISRGDFYRIGDERLSRQRGLWCRHCRFKERFVPDTARSVMRCQDLVMNRLYRRNSQMSDQFAQDKRLKRAEFFLINRFAVAAAVLGAMVGRTGVKTIEPPS
jgi:hypothetical protein